MDFIVAVLFCTILLAIWIAVGCLVLTIVNKHDRLMQVYLESDFLDRLTIVVLWPEFAWAVYEYGRKDNS